MALTGIQIFKMTPKKNCKECGCPTCMAFSMKVAQGAMDISACPYMSEEALAQLSEATAPPMKTIKIGTGDNEYSLGGETVLYRHEKTFVSKTRYAVALCSCMDDAAIDAKLAQVAKVDYERIGEQMHAELLYVNYDEASGADRYVEVVKKAAASGKVLVLGCTDPEVAAKALAECKDGKPVLNGANASNYEAMNKVATETGVVLGVGGATIDELYRYGSRSGEAWQQKPDDRHNRRHHQRYLRNYRTGKTCGAEGYGSYVRISVHRKSCKDCERR